MIPAFDLHIPKSIEEACRLKLDLRGKSEVIAGGTDVFVSMHGGKLRLENIIDLKGIDELKGMSWSDEEGFNIGALTSLHEVEMHPQIQKKYHAVFEGINTIGSYQIRNRATMGGNICTAAPSADGIGPLLVYNTQCCIQGLDGTRIVPLEEFFIGPMKTVLGEDEILTQIIIPPAPADSVSAYRKFGRRKAMEIALQAVSVYLQVEESTTICKECRIALATSAPTPIRARNAEAFILGKNLSDEKVMKELGQVVLTDANPRSSWRSSAEFRKHLLSILVPRTVTKALQKINEVQ